MGLKGVKVNGQTYHFDHEYLENNPIPAYGCNDKIGKVLSVNDYNKLEWMEVIPPFDPTADDGDVLTVEKNGSYTELVWKSIDGWSSPLPTYDTTYPSSDEGKVLTVSDCGSLEWVAIRPNGLPDGGSTGQVLGIDTDGEPNWVYPEHDNGQYIDSFSDSDLGKVLTVTSDCALGWVTPDSLLPEIPTGSTVFSPLVLTVNDGSIEWGQINDILCVGGSDGVLTYRSGELIWSNVLPGYDENDDGKVLSVVDGELEWTDIWSGAGEYIPEFDGNDSGKVPIVVSGNHIEWGSELPEYDESDEGRVLTVNHVGELVWAMPS